MAGKNKYPFVRLCEWCGSAFVITGRAQARCKFCCEDCREIAQLTRMRNYYQNHKEDYKRRRDKAKGKDTKKQQSTLVEVAKEAKAAGMTYGQYMQAQYAKEHKWRKHNDYS